MHTLRALYDLLRHSVPSIHATRLTALGAAVLSLTTGAQANLTSLGRGLTGSAYTKHKIKRIDRLLSNSHLYQERHFIYRAFTERLLAHLPEAIIAIDWSPLCADQSWHLLRAAMPLGGRSLTLYEEVHPQSKLGNRKVQHRFLRQLATLIPATCCPIVVADSGFRTPFFRYIENQFEWHWVGRIRGRDFICRESQPGRWFSSKLLYSKATLTARCLGVVSWVRNQPLAAFIVLIRQARKRRTSRTFNGNKRRSKHNQMHARREREPWILVAALSLQSRTPKQIVKIYKTRLQIEEGFRDCKSRQYGLSLSQHRHMNPQRRSILCLIVTCAIFVLWCIGMAGQHSQLARQVRVNSSSKRAPYSVIFLARLLISESRLSLSKRSIDHALRQLSTYMESVLCN